MTGLQLLVSADPWSMKVCLAVSLGRGIQFT
jgi:hypothetical protein